MNRFLLFAILINFSLNAQTNTTKAEKPFFVFQLFTSQGCSSCPPADALLEKVKKENLDKNVVVLSYHVDYWNYIGWNDPFSSRAFTKVQYAYGKKFKRNRVYTPQLVVNGRDHFVGSNQTRVKKILNKYASSISENTITLDQIKKQNNILSAAYSINGTLDDKNIVIALVLERKSTFVKKGENRNKEITNSNIVLNQLALPLSSSKGKIKIEIPESYTDESNLRLIAFIQKNNLEITGTTQHQL